MISIHALRVESDNFLRVDFDDDDISIHALRVESDEGIISLCALCGIFQSTLSVWRATEYSDNGDIRMGDFNPRSPCGERLTD